MANAVVPDLSNEPLSVRINYPKEERWNTDREQIKENRLNELSVTLPPADVVGIVDSDSDGLACEVVIREAFPDKNVEVIQGSGGKYGFNLPEILSYVGDYTNADTKVIVADLAPDAQYSSYLSGLSNIDGDIHIYDHHDWEWFAKESIQGVASVTLKDDKCAAQIVQEEEYPEADEQLVEFLEVTADHDLWHKEDERSDHLSTLSFVLDREKYVSASRKYGANMLAESEELKILYEETEEEDDRRSELAKNRAEWYEINGHTVAITYANCHQSRVGDELISEGADLTVIIQPWLKISFRSADHLPICSELARELNGGGHEHAAGGSIYRKVDTPADGTPKLEAVWENEGEEAVAVMEQFLRENL